MLLGRLYNLGTYIFILSQIFKKVLTLFFLYGGFIFGFAVTFYFIQVEGFTKAVEFNKMLTMMVGELDTEDFDDCFKAFIFMCFIFLVPIIMNNLMISLTVSDVKDLIENANVHSLLSKMETISLIENTYLVKFVDMVASKFCSPSRLFYGKDTSLQVVLAIL